MVNTTLVIGDLHFTESPLGILPSQVSCIKKIIESAQEVDDIIFLGDLMMHRKPSPYVLLALKEVMDSIPSSKKVYILRGNHDSANKSDDGQTALSLLESESVKVITQVWVDDNNKRVFIPHYEDDDRLRKFLLDVPKGYTVFGHFGYNGVLDSAGDSDFGLVVEDFKNPTILGHIHKESSNGMITILGTPYSTNYGEERKDCYYGILTEGTKLSKIPITWGPRHLVVDYDDVETNLDWLNSQGQWYTLLRITLNTIDEDQDSIAKLINMLDVARVEIKYKALLNNKEEFTPNSENLVTQITDELIEEYINSSNTTINKATLLEGLKIIHENQQNRNN